MKNNTRGRTSTSLPWPAMLLAGVGLWYWLAPGSSVGAWWSGGTLVQALLLTIYWFWCARATRRFHAAMDTYANREIERARRLNAPRKSRPVSVAYRLEEPNGPKGPVQGYNRSHAHAAAARTRRKSSSQKEVAAVDPLLVRASLE